jgi:hypothetical protein
MNISPRGIEVVFSPFSERFHRLTSPKMWTLLDFSTVRTRWKSAPFRVGYLRACGPIHPATGWRSLAPTSHTLCSIPLPYGRDTTYVGSVGLTQFSMRKIVAGLVGVYAPVGFLDVVATSVGVAILPTHLLVMACQPLWPFAHSRGFRLTLHSCSTLPAFPSPPPQRGLQRSEHCPQSFAPWIAPQHVWVGTPGHHRARSGFFSPCSILPHGSYGVQRLYVRSPPGHKPLKWRGFLGQHPQRSA